jgi:hypothetical protein
LGRVGNFTHAVARTSVKCQVFLPATDPRKDHYSGHSLRTRLSRTGMNAHPTTFINRYSTVIINIKLN